MTSGYTDFPLPQNSQNHNMATRKIKDSNTCSLKEPNKYDQWSLARARGNNFWLIYGKIVNQSWPVWLTSADLDTRTRQILVRFSGSRLVDSWLVKSDHNRLFRSIFASSRNRYGKNFHDILNFDASRVVRVLPQYSYSRVSPRVSSTREYVSHSDKFTYRRNDQQ